MAAGALTYVNGGAAPSAPGAPITGLSFYIVDVSAGFWHNFCYRRHDVHLLYGPPGSLARSGLFRGRGQPVSTRVNARGRGSSDRAGIAAGAASRGRPIKTMADASPHGRPGGAANDAILDHTRAPDIRVERTR